MAKTKPGNLSLFGDEPVKPESRKEKKAKQNAPLAFRGKPVTMADLWAERDASIGTKRLIHWNASGPFGGSTTNAACGALLKGAEANVLVELVTCLKCRTKAAQAWIAMAMHARGIDETDEEE